MASLYLHIPFCRSKCAYCDFASRAGREGDIERYVSMLRDEIRASSLKNVETIFFGGGTPSLLTGAQVECILQAAAHSFSITQGAEITMEANPGTVTDAALLAYRRAGVNRLSLGVQSFDGALLRQIGRTHTPKDAEDACLMARAAGFKNISLDLIYGLPGQTVEGFLSCVERAISLNVDHLSLYALIVEPGTPLYDEDPELPDEDAVLTMQHAAQALLARAGLYRYEISNYAKPGMECRHNLVYWSRGDYLGIGCAAHSLLDGERFQNTKDIDEYLSGVRAVERERLTSESMRDETIMLSTRTRAGIDLNAFTHQFGEDLVMTKSREIQRLKSLNLIEISDSRLSLTDAGMDVQNAVVAALV